MKIINLLKRPFCSHSYRICTFPIQVRDLRWDAPCVTVWNEGLFECSKCGKKIVKEVTE